VSSIPRALTGPARNPRASLHLPTAPDPFQPPGATSGRPRGAGLQLPQPCPARPQAHHTGPTGRPVAQPGRGPALSLWRRATPRAAAVGQALAARPCPDAPTEPLAPTMPCRAAPPCQEFLCLSPNYGKAKSFMLCRKCSLQYTFLKNMTHTSYSSSFSLLLFPEIINLLLSTMMTVTKS